MDLSEMKIIAKHSRTEYELRDALLSAITEIKQLQVEKAVLRQQKDEAWTTTGLLAEQKRNDLVRDENERLRNKVAELSDALAAVMAPEWRDVGTLPKIDPDTCRSNDLLGYWPNGSMMVVYLDVCNGWMDAEGGESCITMPTHWRPLPSTPEEESV